MRFSPEILACHAEFGGDLEDMQRRYDAARLKSMITRWIAEGKGACGVAGQ